MNVTNMFQKVIFAVAVSFFYAFTLSAQIRITGTVNDDTGSSLPGVNVTVKGTSTGSVSDANGQYAITVSGEDAVLVFSFVGFATQEILVGNQQIINVALVEGTSLDEVVVIGYGTVRKSDLTGSIVSISSDKFRNQPQSGVSQILQGKAAGVNITSTSGAGNVSIRIRGVTSLNKSSEPLWVVDGVIGGVVGNFHDIQSIEVLKDASATAIYGSQGANGVILVTTKAVQEGRAQVTFDARYNWRTLRKKPDLLNAAEFTKAYGDFVGEGYISPEDAAGYINGSKPGIDWIDLMTQTGFTQTYNLNISGGNPKTKYRISGWGSDDKGQWVTTSQRSYNVKAQLDTEIAPWLNLSGYIHGSTSKSHNANTGYNQFSKLTGFSPVNDALTDENGVYLYDRLTPFWNNPMAEVKAQYTDGENASATAFGDLKIKLPVDGLTLSIQGLYARSHSMSRFFKSTKLYQGAVSEASNSSSQNHSMRNINNLTYQKEFGDHRLTATAVFEATKYVGTVLTGTARELPQEVLEYWALGTGANQQATNSYTNTAMVSAFGRVMYSYKGKYMFTGTYRADAPSQFRDQYKWGYFPSAAVAWNVAEEDFMNKDLIQQLKLRASAGVTGNHGVGAYATLVTMMQDNAVYGLDQQLAGYWLNNFSNPQIRWEKNTQYNIGLDVGVFNQRLNLTIDWYNKQTTDMLFQKTMPLVYGGAPMWLNQGRLDNDGWEFTVNAHPFTRGDFKWESTLTASYTNTVVKDLAGEERLYPDGGRGGTIGDLFILQPGLPVGVFYLHDWLGFDERGANLYRTADGGTTTSPSSSDRFVMGTSMPKWLFGWSNQFTYKNWDLNVFFRGTGKYSRLNISRYFMSTRTAATFPTSREGYYQNWDRVANKSNAAIASYSNPENTDRASSSQWLENAAFLRLQNLTLGYQVPRNLTKFVGVHLSLSGENLFVLSKYSGLDPETVSEVDAIRQDGSFGMDDGSFPMPRAFTFIVRLDF